MRITKLDGLRGIFSLMVVFYHYVKIFEANNLILLPIQLNNNFLIRQSHSFVDFFFVLSGFVIALNYNSITSLKSYGTYLKKRFLRLYPLLLFTALLFCIFQILVNLYFKQFIESPATLNFILKKTFDTLFFLNSTPIFMDTGLGINPPSWSISSEMISYVLFGFLFLIKAVKRNVIIFLVILLSSIFLISKGIFFAEGNYGFFRGFVSFGIGYFVWYFSRKNVSFNSQSEVLVPILISISLYILNYLNGFDKQLFGLCSIPLVFGVCIFILIKSEGFISTILISRPLQFLGKISYSIYLNHFLLIVIIPRACFYITGIRQNTLNELLIFIGVVVFTIIYSNFTYKYIERKVGVYLRRKLVKTY